LKTAKIEIDDSFMTGLTLRHKDVIDWKALRLPIHIIGCGSIGSFTALGLAKMGATNIVLWDEDEVDTHNIGNQFFRIEDVGQIKVKAAEELVYMMSGIKPHKMPKFFEPSDAPALEGIVIMALDKMGPRMDVWKACKGNPKILQVIDLRMGLESMRLVTVDPNLSSHHEAYEQSWYPDEEATPARCTEKTIIYTVFFGAGAIVQRVKQILKGDHYDVHIGFDIPTLLPITIRE
jgi:hypothetical protein